MLEREVKTDVKSFVAQRKRAGLITRRTLDRNEQQLDRCIFSFCIFCAGGVRFELVGVEPGDILVFNRLR